MLRAVATSARTEHLHLETAMNDLFVALQHDLLNPRTPVGAVGLGLLFLVLASTLAALVRKAARGIEIHLSDTTGLSFASAFGQVFVYIVALILYAHLIPDLRAVGTALLAGASVVSVVFGLAAQSTLSNMIAGFSLVMYRPIRVGDFIQLNTPKGLITANVKLISLGYTILLDGEQDHIFVPNSLMMSTIVIRKEGRGAAAPNAAPERGR
jgi:small-conductance mechanosensitive channel